MKLISENIHIISPKTKEAILAKDESYINNLLLNLIETNPNWIDLNIGPAKGQFSGSMCWLVKLVRALTNLPLSFDSSNVAEIEAGLSLVQNASECLINSTSADIDKLEKITDLASKYDCNLVALTMNKELGIPKDADKRLELAFEIFSVTESKRISNDKLYFDPLILPICFEQSQALEALNTIRMLNESFEPPVNTIIGLSNLSNGCPSSLRSLLNRVFFVMAAGCGLQSAIVDSFDFELLRINKLLETRIVETSYDSLYLNLFKMMQNFDELESLSYDVEDVEQVKLYKTAEIILNKKVYTNSYLDI